MADPIHKQVSHAQRPETQGRGGLGRFLRSRAFAGGLMTLGAAGIVYAYSSLFTRCERFERIDTMATICIEAKSPVNSIEVGSVIVGFGFLAAGLTSSNSSKERGHP